MSTGPELEYNWLDLANQIILISDEKFKFMYYMWITLLEYTLINLEYIKRYSLSLWFIKTFKNEKITKNRVSSTPSLHSRKW
jgi:hypothetical protein